MRNTCAWMSIGLGIVGTLAFAGRTLLVQGLTEGNQCVISGRAADGTKSVQLGNLSGEIISAPSCGCCAQAPMYQAGLAGAAATGLGMASAAAAVGAVAYGIAWGACFVNDRRRRARLDALPADTWKGLEA